MTTGVSEIFTIGHSNRSLDEFLELLRANGIEVVVDVRSVPRCGYARHFDKEQLVPALRREGLRYLFLGEQLGGRPPHPALYSESERRVRGGQVKRYCDYEKVRDWSPFREGIARLLEGARRFRIALMCAEKEPLDCHRALLIAEVLRERGVRVRHIRDERTVQDHEDTRRQALSDEDRACALLWPPEEHERWVEQALRKRAEKVAFRESVEVLRSEEGRPL